jgi:tRNA pseudouridine38-40 synthase
MRYFAELAYCGTSYAGWQKQPDQRTVQSVLEHWLSTLLRTHVEVTGCGRTDTGVHARYYVAHFDVPELLPENFLFRINQVLPSDIVVYRIWEVAPEAHARFDARHRAYEYHLCGVKDPFRQHTSLYYPRASAVNWEQAQAAVKLLLDYQEFFPFCKSDHDAHTLRCDLRRSEWIWDADTQQGVYHISADRFLRGMVRLIVGMSLQVGLGKLELEQVRHALDTQTLLPKSLSAPPEGLFLTEVVY